MHILTRRKAALLPLALAVTGCAATLSYQECTTDEDCAGRAVDGGRLFCTGDNLCVLGAPAATLCYDQVGADVPGALVVGVLVDKSSTFDIPVADAIKLAANEIYPQQAGGQQPPLVVHFCDTASDTAQLLKAAKQLVEVYHASALIGPLGSDPALALIPYLVQTGTLAVSPAATAKQLTSANDNGLFWRTVPADDLQAIALAGRVNDAYKAQMVMGNVVVLFAPTVYAMGLKDDFITALSMLSGPMPTSLPFTNASDIAVEVSMMGAKMPTQAVLIADVQDPLILSLIAGPPAQPGLAKTQFFMTDTAQTPELWQGNSSGPGTTNVDLLNRVSGTSPGHAMSGTYQSFLSNFTGKFPKDNPNTAYITNAYDAMYVIAIAAAATAGHAASGAELKVGMSKILPNVPNGVSVPVGSGGYLAAVMKEAAGGVKLDGASGPLSFTAAGDLYSEAIVDYQYWCINTTNLPNFTFKDCP